MTTPQQRAEHFRGIHSEIETLAGLVKQAGQLTNPLKKAQIAELALAHLPTAMTGIYVLLRDQEQRLAKLEQEKCDS